MDGEAEHHLKLIDDLTSELARIRVLGDSRLETQYHVVDILKKLRYHNWQLGTRKARKQLSTRPEDAMEIQEATLELNLARFGAMAGGYLASGYYLKLGLKWLLSRLFGRPAV